MSYSRTLLDQMNRPVNLPEHPKRIVSLVPSQTELLCDLGLEDNIVGITRFCVHPENLLKEKIKVGGTKNVNFRVLSELNPDIILANKEENTRHELEELSEKCPVWITNVIGFNDALAMINDFGKIFHVEERSQQLAQEITEAFNLNLKNLQAVKGKSVLYFIWRKPYMVAGKDCFIHTMLSRCGLVNAIDGNVHKERYVTLEPDEIHRIKPDFIFLSSEPFPFKERHLKEMEEISPYSKVLNVDGEMFSWYGSRLKLAPTYFRQLLSSIEVNS